MKRSIIIQFTEVECVSLSLFYHSSILHCPNICERLINEISSSFFFNKDHKQNTFISYQTNAQFCWETNIFWDVVVLNGDCACNVKACRRDPHLAWNFFIVFCLSKTYAGIICFSFCCFWKKPCFGGFPFRAIIRLKAFVL